MMNLISIVRYIIRTIQKIILGLFLSYLFPIDLIDILQYFIPTDTPSLVEASLEDNIEEDNSARETNNNYLLVIIPLTTILIVIVGGIIDLQVENLLLSETIVDLLVIAEEHVYKSEIIESNLYG
jgi:hypothetical protein